MLPLAGIGTCGSAMSVVLGESIEKRSSVSSTLFSKSCFVATRTTEGISG